MGGCAGHLGSSSAVRIAQIIQFALWSDVGSLLLLPSVLLVTGEHACRGKVNKTLVSILTVGICYVCIVPDGVGISTVKKVFDIEAMVVSEMCFHASSGADCGALS